MNRLFVFISFFILYSCTQAPTHSALEAELFNCRESYEKEIAAQKLIGSWKLAAEGCGFCPTADGIFDPQSQVSLLFDTIQRVIIYKDNIPTDTIPYIFSTTISDNVFWLDTGKDHFSSYISGGLVFCKEFIGFDSRAGDGPVYYFQKTN